ncbi:type IV secretory system conjugative DNA transfer family protein [Arsenophonus nasoniae]|uniref:Type IV secretory system conjugative DNA transfer family protein n=1 Tax=Arsenophonus nasoniae TaxID=638 RepID=A0ABY8NXD9_9GAMM|nr:type IV secretory system conjugative DNA transfer family protein [Arsenophonus nasoniae]WGM09015.1 type IV secretory system conjugative DNA transfer family protein [Arsenophonus nasoniae]
MKTFNRPQSVALLIVMLPLTYLSGSALFFLFYFHQIKGLGILKSALNIFNRYRLEAFNRALWDSAVTGEIKLLAYLALAVGFGIACTLPLLALIKLNEKDKNIYGNAKFSTLDEVKKSSNFTLDGDEKKGIIVGQLNNKLIRYIGAAFSAMGAGTRAGKGAGIVIPNLLKYWWSIIILDPKRECFNITSLVRKYLLGQQVYKFDPFSSDTHRFNPLFYIQLGTNEGFNQLENLAKIFYPFDENDAGAGAFLNKCAGNLFQSMVIALKFYIEHDKSYLDEREINANHSLSKMTELFIRANHNDIIHFLESLKDSLKGKQKTLLYIALDGLNTYLKMEDKTRSQAESVFLNALSPFRNPNVAKATDGNDFDLRKVRQERMTIYYCVSGDNAGLASKITNVFFQMALQLNLEKTPTEDPTIAHDCLFLLDEFPSIGAVDYIKSKSGIIAGYKLKLLIVYQAGSQLDEIYGYAGSKTLLSSAPCKIIYSASDNSDARMLSESLGTVTVEAPSKSISRHKGSLSRSESKNLIERPLITSNELLTLKFSDEIINMKGENPIACKKAFYYLDPYFYYDFLNASPAIKSFFKQKGNLYLMPDQDIFEKNIVAKGYLAVNDVPNWDNEEKE